MKIMLAERDQDLLAKLSGLHFNCGSLREYLDTYRETTRLLFQSEYNGIALFCNRTLSESLSVHNNPDEFNRFYFEKLLDKDRTLKNLIANPYVVHILRNKEMNNPENYEYFKELNNVRPGCGDFFYDPILFRHEIIGFMAQVKPKHDSSFLDEKDLFLQRLIKPLLFSGIYFFSNKEKIELLGQNQKSRDFAYFYYSINGQIEIPEPNREDILEDVFRVRGDLFQSLENHPFVKTIFNSFKVDSYNSPIVEHIRVRDDDYILRAFKKDWRSDIPIYILITVEKDSKSLDYSEIRQRYSLTVRETEITEYIMKGMSNKAIGCRLFISEATVKRHISHIFEKTGYRNRMQLAMSLFQ